MSDENFSDLNETSTYVKSTNHGSYHAKQFKLPNITVVQYEGFLSTWVVRSDLFFFGLCGITNGLYSYWNLGLAISGFGTYLIVIIWMGSAYFCYLRCTAELSSAIPFAGGSYGLARITLGNYLGYFVGTMESLEYIALTAVFNYYFILLIVQMEPSMTV